MAVNDLTFEQISTILTDIVSQATGKKAIAPTNTNEFITVATTALKTGYDPLLTSISQVLSRTIFSSRVYTPKFKSLRVSNQRYGNHVRKVNFIANGFQDDSRFELTDGESIDMYTVKKPQVLQTNFYGANVYEKQITRYKDQLDCALSGPDEFASFITGYLVEARNEINQAHEATARATINNFIGGKILSDSTNVIKVLTEYKAATGLELTGTDVLQPENYDGFIRWLFGRLETISDRMTERTVNMHVNVAGKEVARHTPYENQRFYLYAPIENNIRSSVLSMSRQKEFMKLATHEKVNYWQAFNNPDRIEVMPSFMSPTGTIQTASAAVTQGNVLGVIFDEEAMGYTVVNEWESTTPLNSRGGYWNTFFHFTDRYWNDFTENAVVLLME